MVEFRLTTPVALFFFNRPDTTLEVFKSIKKAKPEVLYLISDGPRSSKVGEDKKVIELRKQIEALIDWECRIEKDYATENMGCHKRIQSGITNVFKKEETAIIIEDDIAVNDSFFRFCQELLEYYKDDEQIYFISGNNLYPAYDIKNSYIVSKFPSIWGWATWKRAWNKFTDDINDWKQMKEDRTLQYYYGRHLGNVLEKYYERAFTGENDTWDYEWEASRMWHHGMGIIPKVNMVKNIGFNRDDATHTSGGSIYDFTCSEMEFPLIHPEKKSNGEHCIEDKYDKGYIKKVENRSFERMYFWGRVKRRIRMLLTKER